jgi:hypothetical protein
MDVWNSAVNSWIVVLIQLGGAIAMVGIAWNAVQLIIDASISGDAQSFPSLLYRILGVLAALFLVLTAPRLVNELAGLLRTPLVR